MLFRFAVAVLAALVCCLATGDALRAGPFRQRSAVERPAQVRLLDAGRDDDTGRYRALVEIALAPGYKTYWREPGDSGVPAEFAWEGSRNVAAAAALFPAPERFFDGVGQAVGYLRTVRFPMLVEPAGEGEVTLALELSFGVCKEICIPEQVSVQRVLGAIADVAGLWDETMAHVPRRTPQGEAFAGLAVSGARLDETGLVVDIAGEAADVFVEAPAPWRFGTPVREERAAGAVFTFPAGTRSDAAGPVQVTLTVVGNNAAIEVPVTVETQAR